MKKKINIELIKLASENTTNIQRKIILDRVDDIVLESILEREINRSVHGYKHITYYIEEIRTGKQELAFKTMYKNKKPGTKGAL